MKMQFIWMSMLFASITFLSATVYENGEDGNTSWKIYDQTPAGATILNKTDPIQEEVISFVGDGLLNAYMLGAISENSPDAWNNTSEHILKWKMKYSEDFIIYVSLNTTKGHKYLLYSAQNYNAGSGHGLGTDTIDGTWKSFSRNLVSDLFDIDNNNTLLSVNGFLIRGTGLIDDVELINETEELTHLKELSFPSCINNPKATSIETFDDWEKLNDEQYQIFCVKPSMKTDSVITITRSGTEENPLYLLLDNGNNEHPVNLGYEELAKYRLKFESANYWIVDRESYWEDENPHHNMIEVYNSSHNIFNRILGKDISSGISLYTGSHENTIQNSQMEKTQWSVDFAVNHRPSTKVLPHYNIRIFADRGAFQLVGLDANDTLMNNVITHNEVVNFIDAVQLVRHGKAEYNQAIHGSQNPQLNAEGTIIEHNNFYITPLVYTDGNGTFTSEGNRSVTENALDFKFGSLNSSNPIIVKENIMFGYRPVDNTYGSLSDNGNAMVFHFGAKNIIIEKNYIFDSNKGFAIGGPKGHEEGAYNLTFRDNIFHNLFSRGAYLVGPTSPKINGEREELFSTAKNILIQNNIFSKIGTKLVNKKISLMIYNTNGVRIEDNKFIDSARMYFAAAFGTLHRSKNLIIKNNVFYNVPFTPPLQSKDEWNSIPDYAEFEGNSLSSVVFSWENYPSEFTIDRFLNGTTHCKQMKKEDNPLMQCD